MVAIFLPMCLKDIAHYFIDLDEEREAILAHLCDLEDAYLQTHDSDFVVAPI